MCVGSDKKAVVVISTLQLPLFTSSQYLAVFTTKSWIGPLSLQKTLIGPVIIQPVEGDSLWMFSKETGEISDLEICAAASQGCWYPSFWTSETPRGHFRMKRSCCLMIPWDEWLTRGTWRYVFCSGNHSASEVKDCSGLSRFPEMLLPFVFNACKLLVASGHRWQDSRWRYRVCRLDESCLQVVLVSCCCFRLCLRVLFSISSSFF